LVLQVKLALHIGC